MIEVGGVTTALTPGKAAAEVSIERMRACACGERRTCRERTAVAKRTVHRTPVTFGTPSGRIGRVPTHLNRVGDISFTAPSTKSLILLPARVARRAQKYKPEAHRGCILKRHKREESHGSGSKAHRHRA